MHPFYLYDEETSLDLKDILLFVKKTFGVNLKIKKVKGIVQTDGLILNLLKTQRPFANKKGCYIVVTKKLLATEDEQNKVHIRTAVFSRICVISIPGIIEGPAKPREFYLEKERYVRLGIWELKESQLKENFKNRFIDYGDGKKIIEVLKGLIAQAIFFYLGGEPFCKIKRCRLYNSHLQEELIYSQIKKADFCKGHKKILEEIRKG